MNNAQALQILRALATGVDPFSGEVLARGLTCATRLHNMERAIGPAPEQMHILRVIVDLLNSDAAENGGRAWLNGAQSGCL